MPEPLAGRVVWLTREPCANEAWRGPFEAAGAVVRSVPCLAVRGRTVPHLKARLARADWLLLTSPSAVQVLAAELQGGSLPPRLQVAVVGPATRASAAAAGWPVALEAGRADGDGLVATLAAHVGLPGVQVFWPRSALADRAPVEALLRAGARVDAPTLYDNACPSDLATRLVTALAEAPPAWIVLASFSAFRHLRAAWPDSPPWGRAQLAAIGARTAQAVAEAGAHVAATAEAPTAAAVLAAMRAVSYSTPEASSNASTSGTGP
ncbi:MAG: uroporphyrinogen-III synthase [Candidatus Sericytochromatia bacterium]|nr:uroporphyrinogen-III synthase [Candidatus Sericytochromatia bacterium]